MSNMIRRSLDPEQQHLSPLGQGKIHEAYDAFDVKLLYWPDEQRFKQMICKAVTATRGNNIAVEEIDPVVVEEAFRGGLNQCLEWVTVVFEISGCSRGLTHELVRTRKASYAQQSMRHTDMGNPNVRMPEVIGQASSEIISTWTGIIRKAQEAYQTLIVDDIPYQDARTVLPLATETYIIASYPLSEFLNTYAYRACSMFYPEIVVLFKKMKTVLVDKCSWLEPYILVSCEKTAARDGHEHQCTYQGWERVEGHCPLAWAKEDNRVWKSSKFEN